MNKRKVIIIMSLFLIGSQLLIINLVSAATNTKTNITPGQSPTTPPRGQMGQTPGIMGTVTSISGTTIVVNSKQGFNRNITNTDTSKEISYTIDASSAKIKKVISLTTNTDSKPVKPTETTISISDIQVGNTITVQGKINGASVQAESIMVGDFANPSATNGKPGDGGDRGNTLADDKKNNPTTDQQKDNRIVGTITSISDNAITLTVKKRQDQAETNVTTYSVDISSAKITKQVNRESQDIAVSDLSVGDMIEVEGTISDTSIVATSVIKRSDASVQSETTASKEQKQTQNSDNKETNKLRSDSNNFFSKIFSSIKGLFGKIFK
jgi:hypothetical protein